MSPTLKAAFWMMGVLASFISMALGGRELSTELSTFEILFFRSLIGLAVIMALLSRSGWRQIQTEMLGLHVVRNCAHYAGQCGWFYGIGILSLAQVFALEFTTPIWIAILAPVLLKERLTGTRIAAIAIGFAGALIILRPGMVPIDTATVAVLMAAAGFAMSHTITKKLSATDTPLCILFYMTVVQLPLGLVPSLFDWVTPSLAHIPWLVIICVAGLTAHFCMIRAFLHADAIVVVPMDFLRLPLVAVIGLVVYGEALDVWVFVGASVIFAGTFLNILKDKRRL
ncbi:MAG TPA: DMT family transporter [Rhodospirillales bacterium]|jgi:drug/metabolite transporter (DMT)-like permease|nr:DMT family transporter [Rhodospirillales bacterium]